MSSPTSTQLFCFPYAGASASVYARWKRQLPPSIEVVPVEPAGHGSRFSEALETTMPRLVAQIESHVRPKEGRRFALFGHSLGALVAFEVARRLELLGGPTPCVLFASGCEAPSAPDRRKLSVELPDDELVAELRRLEGTPAAVLDSAELMQLMLPILRADFRVVASYRALGVSAVIRTPIEILTGTTDKLDPAAVSGWRKHTRGAVSTHSFEGGHFFIHDRERDVLATVVRTLTASSHPLGEVHDAG